MSDDISFWARRRAAVQAEAEAQTRTEEEAKATARAEELARKDDAEILAEMGLPDPSKMQQGDNFAVFMARDVPEHLRKQALRTLWRSNPVLACVDGLNEYDDDYRAAMLKQGPIKTAYQVGKGMMKHVEEMERQANASEECDPPEQEAEAPIEVAEVAQDASLSEQSDAAMVEHKQPEAIPQQTEHQAAPLPRRMRFHFEEASA